MSDKKIAIIGGGHIGGAFKTGLVKSGIAKSRIAVSNASSQNAQAAKGARIIFLAVKTSVIAGALRDIQDAAPAALVVSLAAGVSISGLRKAAGKSRMKLARAMPNMPIAVNEGVVGFFGGEMNASEKAEVIRLLSRLGMCAEVENEQGLETFTLVSGCGPGIVSYLVGVLAGKADPALALQTFKGTIVYLEETGMTAAELMKAVATKGGVTEEILSTLSKNGFEKKFTEAMKKGLAKIHHVQKNRH